MNLWLGPIQFLWRNLMANSYLNSFMQKLRLRRTWRLFFSLVAAVCFGIICVAQRSPVIAQTDTAVEQQEESVIQKYSLPSQPVRQPVVQPRRPSRPTGSTEGPSRPTQPTTSPAPSSPAPSANPEPQTNPSSPAAPSQPEPETTVATAPLSQYVLQFNRAPVVGNALQLEGVLSQARLSFTRPRQWQVESAKVQIRFRHSPALYANRSNLTVRLNNIHLGSVPLNRSADEIGNVLFDVPTDLLQDYNTIIIEAQQHTSQECTDPTDPTLWTEVLPDSRILMNYRPQPIALDFASYPYPFLDDLGLDADQLAYLRPKAINDAWLTASSRYQAAAARQSNFRSIQSRVINQLDEINPEERLIIIGTPTEQPALANLELPFAVKNNKVLDGGGNALPNDVGVLMLTTAQDSSTPVLIATGNDASGVLKAVQALVQQSDRQLLTGQAVLVSEISSVGSPDARDWPGYLPASASQVRLSDLRLENGKAFDDITVNGLPVPPPVEVPVRLLPDERLNRGSTFTLRYSYGPGIDPKRSSVTVRLNGQGIGGERLKSADGGSGTLTIDVPPALITPTSKLAVQFYTFPQVAVACGEMPNQPLWGTVHGDSSFKLNRSNVVQLPNLKLLPEGYPLTAPQDLSGTALVVPQQPSNLVLETLLQTSSRLGKLSRSESVKLETYQSDTLPQSVRQEKHVVTIGIGEDLPLAEAFDSETGMVLSAGFLRQREQTQMQTLPDSAGVIQAQVSPWHSERLLLGLTSQTDTGLEAVRQLFSREALFSQLAGDTVLVQPGVEPALPFSPTGGYRVTALEQTPPRTLDRRSLMGQAIAFLQSHWLLLPVGIVLVALLGYGVSQVYLNRLTRSGEV